MPPLRVVTITSFIANCSSSVPDPPIYRTPFPKATRDAVDFTLFVPSPSFAVNAQPTVSVGVVSYPADGRSADALLVSADRAMYASKRSGKNRVARATTEPMVLPIEQHEGGRSREGERAG